MVFTLSGADYGSDIDSAGAFRRIGSEIPLAVVDIRNLAVSNWRRHSLFLFVVAAGLDDFCCLHDQEGKCAGFVRIWCNSAS